VRKNTLPHIYIYIYIYIYKKNINLYIKSRSRDGTSVFAIISMANCPNYGREASNLWSNDVVLLPPPPPIKRRGAYRIRLGL